MAAHVLPRSAVLGATLVALVGFGSAAQAATAPVGLGTTSAFAVLAGSTVTNTGPTVLSGDLGVSPGTAVTGFPPGIVNNGTSHVADGVAAQAQSDATVAYDDAAARGPAAAAPADFVGRTLTPGVYRGGTLGLTGTMTLDGQGDPAAVFVFQSASTLVTGSSSTVALIGGASPCNVFWQVGSSATLGTDSRMVGTVIALTSITATTRADIQGRLVARNGAVTLDSNTVTRPACAVAPSPTATTTPTQSATGTTSGTPTGTPTASGTTGPTAPVRETPVSGAPGGPQGPAVPSLPLTGVPIAAATGLATTAAGLGLLLLVLERRIRTRPVPLRRGRHAAR